LSLRSRREKQARNDRSLRDPCAARVALAAIIFGDNHGVAQLDATRAFPDSPISLISTDGGNRAVHKKL
jgi:hypothetical protein